MSRSWAQVPLGKVLVQQKDRAGVFDADGLPLLGVSNTGGLHRTEKPRIADMSRYLRVDHRWFAYNPMRINVGSVGWAERPDQTGVISPDYVVFSCTSQIEPKLLYLFLRSAIGLRAINLETAGSVRERLYFESLARIRFSLPPLPEQRRIVARIEELAAKINEARGLRDMAAAEAESLGHFSLNSIAGTGVAARSLSEVCIQITDGEHATPPRVEEQEIPLATAKNVRDGYLDMRFTDFVTRVTADYCWKRCKPSDGDVLMVCVGATTGRVCRLVLPPDMVIVRSVALLRPNGEILDSRFLEYALESRETQEQIWN